MSNSLWLQAPLSMGILQARILEWVAMPSPRGSSPPRNGTGVSCIAVTPLLSYLRSPTNHDGTANQNYLTSVRMAIIKKTTDKKCWPERREIGILVLFWWECAVIMENNMEFPQKKKKSIEGPYDSAVPLLALYPKELKLTSQRGVYFPMFTAALFIIAKI